jgi:hypothetical protein
MVIAALISAALGAVLFLVAFAMSREAGRE